MVQSTKAPVTVIYKGDEIDITSFISQHPGGREIIEEFLKHKQDISEYFKSIHSLQAQQKLLRMKVVNTHKQPKFERVYFSIQERISRYYQPSWATQIFYLFILFLTFSALWFIHSPIAVILIFSFLQIFGAWLAHSQLHLRDTCLRKSGKIIGAFICGLSSIWWQKKHLRHHIFTNSDTLDEDIQHNYRLLYYPLLLFKWRLESIWTAITKRNILEIILLGLHYCLLYKQKPALLLTGLLIASFYMSLVVIGNHSRQKRYRGAVDDMFLAHQLQTTRSYQYENDLMVVAMGGFQFHTEHHLFPKVPFYNLKTAHKVILQELQIHKKNINCSTIL